MFDTVNMGLTAWDQGSDPYDHTQLATNFDLIDQHDHTSGKGLPIPSGGIADGSITSSKLATNSVQPATHIPVDSIPQSRLADGSVGTNELLDNAVTTAKIANGAVTLAKLDSTILPPGFVALWYRADPSVLPPTGWEIMDGRAWSTITNKLGAGGTQWNTGNIPNMANKFPLGAALSGTGTTATTPPDFGASGGQHLRDLSHSHSTNPHSHVVDSHTHGVSADGAHKHRFVAQTPGGQEMEDAFTRDVGVPRADGTRQALYVPGHNQFSFLGSDIVTPLETVAAHSHGGATGATAPNTNAVAGVVNTGLTGNQDLRPAFIGLLFIMKVV